MFRQLFSDSLIRMADNGGFAHDDDIEIPKPRTLPAKAFANLALYSIPLYGRARAFSRYDQAQSRMSTFIGFDQEREART